MRRAFVLVLLLASAPLLAVEAGAVTASADAARINLVEYFLNTPLSDVIPSEVAPFLAIDTETLPKLMRVKAYAKQIQIRTLFKLHDTKKKGNWLQPADCDPHSFIMPLKKAPIYELAGYEKLTEDEEQYIMSKTHCTEEDLGCQFSLMIFFDKGKPRRLMIDPSDPIAALVAGSHGRGGQTNFFGLGLTCYHPQ